MHDQERKVVMSQLSCIQMVSFIHITLCLLTCRHLVLEEAMARVQQQRRLNKSSKGSKGSKGKKAITRPANKRTRVVAAAAEKTGPKVATLKEIRDYQMCYKPIIPKTHIHRMVRSFLEDAERRGTHLGVTSIESGALTLIRRVLEDEMLLFFEKSKLATMHAKRKTLMGRDLMLIDTIENM